MDDLSFLIKSRVLNSTARSFKNQLVYLKKLTHDSNEPRLKMEYGGGGHLKIGIEI